MVLVIRGQVWPGCAFATPRGSSAQPRLSHVAKTLPAIQGCQHKPPARVAAHPAPNPRRLARSIRPRHSSQLSEYDCPTRPAALTRPGHVTCSSSALLRSPLAECHVRLGPDGFHGATQRGQDGFRQAGIHCHSDRKATERWWPRVAMAGFRPPARQYHNLPRPDW